MRTATSGYFDAASAAPLHPVAQEALQAALEDGWADPSRLTGASRRSASLLTAARATLAGLLEVEPDELTFTASGAQALHLGVLGALAGRRRAGNTLVHSAVEHSAVLHAAEWHVARGGSVQVVGVDGTGRADAAEFVEIARQPGVAASVLQAANHEVGTRQPVAEVLGGLEDTAVPLVVDATHELPFATPAAHPAVLTGDARVWGGPSGVGLLVVRRGSRWVNPFPADESEHGRGSGPVNVPAIVAAAASLRAVRIEADATAARLSAFIEQIRQRVPTLVPDCEVLGHPTQRLPHVVTFSVLYVDGEALLTELDRRGFAVSSGSSCTSDTLTPSHVLVAMRALTSGNVRVSLHSGVTQEDIDTFLATLPEAVASVRAHLPRETEGKWWLDDHNPSVVEVDSRGRRCPAPILDLAKAWPNVPVGAEIVVLADDPAAATDIEAWCRMRAQELVDSTDAGNGATAYRVRRLS